MEYFFIELYDDKQNMQSFIFIYVSENAQIKKTNCYKVKEN